MRSKVYLSLFLILVFAGGMAASAQVDEIALTQTVQASQTAQYPLEIHNAANAVHEYTLLVAGFPDLFDVTITAGGPLIGKISIEPKAYARFDLRVTIPADTPVGHYTAAFSSVREDGATLTIPLTLQVENQFAVAIVSQVLNMNTFSGRAFTFDTTAANTGAADLTNLSLSVAAPSKWIVQTEPLAVEKLAPGAEIIFHTQVIIPASQNSLDQPMPLTVTSQEAVSPESIVAVRVQKSPAFFYSALALMGLAVGGVFLYFRSKGRR